MEQVADDVHRERRHAALGNQEGFPAVVGIHGDIDDQDGVADGVVAVGLIDQDIAGGDFGEGFLCQFVTVDDSKDLACCYRNSTVRWETLKRASESPDSPR